MEYKLNVSHESITIDVTDELIHSITGCVFLTHRGELLISKKSGGFMEIVGVDNESIVFQTFEQKKSLSIPNWEIVVFTTFKPVKKDVVAYVKVNSMY